jgi:O-antigen/teichoic acid export membrane protein
LPINALALIQKTILTKRLDFKIQAIASFSGTLFGFLAAMFLVFKGLGVWALVAKTLITQAINLLILWLANDWKPSRLFSINSFRELFGFGSKLLVIYLMAQILRSIFDSIIGKTYSKEKLGNYSNADSMAVIQSEIMTVMLNKVAFSALSNFGNSPKLLKENLQKIMSPFVIISFTMSCILIATAKPLILAALGEQWIGAVWYFQMLCIGYSAVILHIQNQIVMNIAGRSDYFLRTEIIKVCLFVPVIILGIIFGLKALIISLIVHYWTGFYINSIYTKKLINYGFLLQIKDIIKPALFAIGVSAPAFFCDFFANINNFSNILTLTLQFSIALFSAFCISKIFKVKAYNQAKKLILNYFRKR